MIKIFYKILGLIAFFLSIYLGALLYIKLFDCIVNHDSCSVFYRVGYVYLILIIFYIGFMALGATWTDQ